MLSTNGGGKRPADVVGVSLPVDAGNTRQKRYPRENAREHGLHIYTGPPSPQVLSQVQTVDVVALNILT